MEKVRIQDDLFMAVNGEWYEKAVIPEDRASTGGFSDLDQEVEKTLMADFKAFAEGKKSTSIPEMKYAIELYNKVLDVERRNFDGIKPLLPLLSMIKNIKSVDDLNKISYDLVLSGGGLPLSVGVTDDMQDATKNSFIMLGPDIILPDTTYYKPNHPQGTNLLKVYENMAREALKLTPLTENEQNEYIADTLYFDSLVAKRVKSQLEWADYVKNHNPMSLEKVAKHVQPFDFVGFLHKVYGDNIPKTIIVYDPRAIKQFKCYFNEKTFTKYVHWCYVKALLSSSQCLSLDLQKIGTQYRRALTGVEKDPVIEKQAYRVASGVFSEPVGVYYGRKYFGEEAKKDVVDMVKKIIETYKVRISKNEFLQPKTKEKAILKLSTIEIKMGYPDKIKEFYKKFKVSKKDSYYDALDKIGRIEIKREFDKLHKPVDRTEWGMPGHMVNACYSPSTNDITFPAAILQAPFYSLKQSFSENLGGIGAVIGHEISHAFDNNGAEFDEKGNLNKWWTKKDYKAFQKLIKAMVKQYDGIPFHGGKVNGELVVSENIADNGGMAVTLEIMHNTKKSDFKAYFKNWAKVWCRKSKEEYIQYLLSNDVHSPAEIRANITPRNFPEWYEAFGVVDTDRMYIEKTKRIIIW